MHTLILGGIKSGKSRLAETLATDAEVLFIATATASDEEMRERIQQHRNSRPAHWTVIEEPLAIAGAIQQHSERHQCVLVDCLTLWLTNLLLCDDADQFTRQRGDLIALLSQIKVPVILVSNEINMGVVPLGELSRRFCDEAGLLHQELAGLCDNVILTVAGIPTYLKGSPVE